MNGGPSSHQPSVSVSRRGPDAGVLRVCINNPPVNALSAPVRAGLIDAATRAMQPGIRAVTLEGNQHCFSAGGDLTELAHFGTEADDDALHGGFLRLYKMWYNIPVPTLVAIRRYALGGALELALSCDIRCAAEGAYFAASGVGVGLVESAHTLLGVVGSGVAAEMLFTAGRLDARDAERVGLVTHVFADVEGGVAALADAIAQQSDGAVRASKAVLRAAQRPMRVNAGEVAVESWSQLRRTSEHRDRVRAFISRHRGGSNCRA